MNGEEERWEGRKARKGERVEKVERVERVEVRGGREDYTG